MSSGAVPCCSGAVPGGNDAPPSAVKIPHSKMEPSAALAFLSAKEEECDRVSSRCAATWSKRGGSVLLIGVGQATQGAAGPPAAAQQWVSRVFPAEEPISCFSSDRISHGLGVGVSISLSYTATQL